MPSLLREDAAGSETAPGAVGPPASSMAPPREALLQRVALRNTSVPGGRSAPLHPSPAAVRLLLLTLLTCCVC